MAGEWRETTLGKFAPLQYGKGLPEACRNAGKVPVYGSNGIVGFHSESLVQGPAVIVGRKGTVGAVHYCRQACWPIDTTFYVTDSDPEQLRFKYYLLKSLGLELMNADSAVPGLNREAAHARVVRVPPLPEQRAIAHILGTLDDHVREKGAECAGLRRLLQHLINQLVSGRWTTEEGKRWLDSVQPFVEALDDKIELNRRMSETLEQMARAIFKAWFVDFEPVRAKMEGRWRRGESLPGLPAHLYDLFPDRLVDSELGEIPEGWEVATFGDHFDAVKGVSYKGSGLGGDGVPLHNLNSVYEGGGYKYEGIKYYTGEYAERHIVRPGDVIVANTEQGHARLLIGYAAIVPKCFGEHGIASHHIYRLRPKPNSPLTAAFLSHLLNSPQIHDVVSGYANGTTVNMLPIDGVQKPQFACPPQQLVAAFDSLVSRAEYRREETVAESRTLAALRDALLSKLISGELRVEDAERFLEKRGLC